MLHSWICAICPNSYGNSWEISHTKLHNIIKYSGRLLLLRGEQKGNGERDLKSSS